MDHRNENPRSGRGQGTAVCSDGRDPITAATLNDALRAACAEVGIVDRDVPADGRWHKTEVDGDPRGRGDGRIKLFPDGEGGIVWNWKGEIRRGREEEARRHAGDARKASEKMTKAPSVRTARRDCGTQYSMRHPFAERWAR